MKIPGYLQVFLFLLLIIFAVLAQLILFPGHSFIFIAPIAILAFDALLKAIFELDTWVSFADVSFASLIHISSKLLEDSVVPIRIFDNQVVLVHTLLLVLLSGVLWIFTLYSLKLMNDAHNKHDKVNRLQRRFGKFMLFCAATFSYVIAVASNLG